MVECLLHCVIEQEQNPSLVMVQPRKTRPFITERLLMGSKESNQPNNCCKPFCIKNNELYLIRIYHECEGRIEKPVCRITVWHHKACQVMTNGDPEGQIFLSYPLTNNGFFFLFTTVFIFKLEHIRWRAIANPHALEKSNGN